MTPEALFEPADIAVLRMSLLSESCAVAPRLLGCGDDAVRAFLASAAADGMTREAIAVSSTSLDRVLAQIEDGRQVERKVLSRGAASLERYLLRMRSRATPFGLMAGIAETRFEAESSVRIGTDHRKYVRPDRAWLEEVIRHLLQDDEIVEVLNVVVNDMIYRRGEHIVLPAVPEQLIQNTAVAEAAMGLARAPIPFSSLLAELTDAFPGTRSESIHELLRNLVEKGILLTDLRPPLTSSDPLGHVADVLNRSEQCKTRETLRSVRDAIDRFATAPLGVGYGPLRAATAAMRGLQPTDRPLHVDLAMDADVVLPDTVARELAVAASVAWSVSVPQPYPLQSYLDEFIHRYGLRDAVPVKELLDPHRGLGSPSGYALPPGHRPAQPRRETFSTRNLVLRSLAQQAAAKQEREIVLNEEILAQLRSPDPDRKIPGYIEVCAQLLADSTEQLQRGAFRIVVRPISYTRPGALYGRFLHYLPRLREDFSGFLRELDGHWAPAAITQLLGTTVDRSAENVAQVPKLAIHELAIGVFAESTDPCVSRLDDIAICARPDRLYAISLRTGEEIIPLTFNANEMRTSAPNPIRLLFQIGLFRTPKWSMWDWDASATDTAFLPRIRIGRTVLAPARWLPDSTLRDPDLSWMQWRAALDRWRSTWAVDGRIEVGSGDQLLPVDLDSASDLRIMRDQLRRAGNVVCQENPADSGVGTGWSNGHMAEIAVSLRPVRQGSVSAARPLAAWQVPSNPAMVRRAFRPGGEWLYLKLTVKAELQDEILTQHLPDLLVAAQMADRWFFTRYVEANPQLRIRFHGEADELNSRFLSDIHAWAEARIEDGLIGDLAICTYRPEIARYGGPDAIDAAERAFHADSNAALSLLGHCGSGGVELPRELVSAVDCLHLAALMHGPGWEQWFLDTYSRDEESHAAFRPYARAAISIVDAINDSSRLALLPDGEALHEGWGLWSPEVSGYSDVLRELVQQEQLESITGPVRSILHMHINRFAGIDSAQEMRIYAIARGAVQAWANRRAHAVI